MTADNLIELAARIGQEQPDIDPVLVSKVLAKLMKLSKTIRNREKHHGYDTVNGVAGYEFKRNTDRFFRKACDLAQSINCEFSAGARGAGPLEEFYLRFARGTTRIL